MKEFKKEVLNPLYFMHERIYNQSYRGYITREQLGIVFRMHYNIPKDEIELWVKGLEDLGLIKKGNDGYFKVVAPTKSREETILEFKKRFGLT